MVSDKLLEAIRACDGLIYLQGGASGESFWVAMERDYALRMGKPVYGYNPADAVLKRDYSSPLDLNVFIASTHHDRAAVELILTVLRQRFFTLQFDNWNVPREHDTNPETHEEERETAARRIAGEISYAIEQGGYVITFWSALAAKSRWVEHHYADAFIKDPSRVLFALLDDTPLPASSETYGVHLDLQPVQAYTDAERSEMQRIDDLIVRLYWLIYRNTRQKQLS
jgi:hypothetical protein